MSCRASFPALVACLLYLLAACLAAVNTPGHCDVLSEAVLQPPDTSAACAALEQYQADHPDTAWSANPYAATAYFGAAGYVAGLTARNQTACCQGMPPRGPCAGACPCNVDNVLHCGRYDDSGQCVAVQQCEIPVQYRWVPDSAQPEPASSSSRVAIIVPLCVAGAALLAVVVVWYMRRLRSSQTGSLATHPASVVELDSGPYAGLDHSLRQPSRL